MFDLPDAKRVRRDELGSPESSSPPLSPELHGSASCPASAELDKFFSLQTFTAPAPEVEDSQRSDATQPDGGKDASGDGGGRAEEEFEFRLFRSPPVAAPRAKEGDGAGVDGTGKDKGQVKEKNGDGETTRTQAKVSRIRIRSPTPAGEGGDGRFVVPFRGWRFYFSDPRVIFGDGYVPERGDDAAVKRDEYLDAAVDGEKVLEWKERPWPGCHLPWRVMHIKTADTGKQKQKQKQNQNPSRAQKKSLLENKDIASCLKKKNLGKKRRIILRKALAAQEAAKEADQEKRTRRNREKKVKRRQREREKKAAAATSGASGSPGAGADTEMGGVESDSGSE